MSDEKSVGKQKEKDLLYKVKNAWLKTNDDLQKKVFDFSDDYKDFLDKGKTERECIDFAVELLEKYGFVDVNDKTKLSAGDKVYFESRNKTIAAAVIGKSDLSEGTTIIGSHIDSPRLDLRPNPLYEDNEMALLKTRYYGGVKTYQWVSTPLAIHGVIYNKNGEKINIVLGEDPGEPVFTVADLLPHLAKKQMQKKAREAISGEDLNVIIGSMPFKDDKVSKKVKLNIMDILNKKYGIYEEDFLSAELEVVPTQKAVDVGLDASMVGAYGHDDRICAYTSLRALIDMKGTPKKTAICYMSDKEEVGSVGNTGARSLFIQNFISELLHKNNTAQADYALRQCFRNTQMLSADVGAGVNPNFKGLHTKNNSAYLGKGVCVEKYTGGNGKGGASDANAEFVFKVRKLFNDNDIAWQSAELGKMDKGGGGTIAQFIANLDSDVIDCGIPVIGMHSTMELANKIDIYYGYLAYKCFYEKMQ